MPRRCNVFGCRGNYPGEPYMKTVSFPKDPNERKKWIDAMPNERLSLSQLSEIHVCESHFTCDWVTARGGKRPSAPPSIFPGVPKSCLKQVSSQPRKTNATRGDRESKLRCRSELQDKIEDFTSFTRDVQKHYPKFRVVHSGEDLYLSMTNSIGQQVIQFIHFRHVTSHFGFLHLVTAEKEGHQIPKNNFSLQKNSLLSKWSQVDEVLLTTANYEICNEDYVKSALNSLDLMCDLHDSSHFQFIDTQLRLLLLTPKARRFNKQVIILATELHNISPSAYKMLRRSGAVILPCIKTIKNLLSRSFQDTNLPILFQQLKPQQKIINVLFDEVKLTQAMRFSGGHVVGYATNGESEILATHAMVIELVCHFGGPRYILRVHPVSKLNSESLKVMLIESLTAIVRAGGTPLSIICDNCPTNQGVYAKLGGPGKVHLKNLDLSLFLVYDYVHIFKNIRNNWITEENQQLSFSVDGKNYVARWSDIRELYEEDRKSLIRLTKLTHTSVFPKPLQRQSVPLVCQVFNDKTVAALSTFKSKLKISEGTIKFVGIITNWFKMLNVKDRFSAIRLRDNFRSPWTLDCDNFSELHKYCDIIATCTWSGGRGRKQKLTKHTGKALTVSTKSNIEASTFLMTEKGFDYVLPAVFADENLEKFFGQTRQRNGGNFYIDVVDVLASAKVTNLHTLVKYGILPVDEPTPACTICEEPPNDDDVELIHDFGLTETQSILSSDDALKHKIVYIAGHLVHKFGEFEADDEEEISSAFLDELNRGGLSMPTLSTVYFVHSGKNLVEQIPTGRRGCRTYLAKILSLIDAPIASNLAACRTLANTLLKAFVLNNSDREKELGCLRRQEKLTK